ncbi:MAG: ABC transporter ATP-binding protein [Corynebacterium sp.]|nr:ABC transporter ATP-binding protein [Corynebacterium sp.]
MTDPAIRVQGLTKYFGATKILDDLEIKVPRGEIYGFLGRNGAGKTTTIRIILQLLRADMGSVSLLGHHDGGWRGSVGYLPDVPTFHPWMTAQDFLSYCGEISGLRGRLLRKRVDMLLETSHLDRNRHRIMNFSRGMKQRLGIAQALIHSPQLIILDEPTSALDPIGRHDVLSMIAALKGKTTVFFSTHLLDDAEHVCDRVGILSNGKLITEEKVDTLVRGSGEKQVLTVQSTEDSQPVASLVRAIQKQGWKVTQTTSQRSSLEEVFINRTRGK